MRRAKGFTILELIVVIFIMGLVVATSIPSFLNFTRNAKLNGAARNIVSCLHSARQYAITNNLRCQVRIYGKNGNPIKNAVLIYSEDSYGSENYSERIERTLRMASGIYIYFQSTNEEIVTFEPTGGAEGSNPETIRVGDGSNERGITVINATGRIKIN